jgi:hypothetical protein
MIKKNKGYKFRLKPSKEQIFFPYKKSIKSGGKNYDRKN